MFDVTLPRPTQLVHAILRDVIRSGDTVVDATAGHGHDTVFLAECVGPSGRVLAFDLQEQAIRSAHARVTAAGLVARVTFHHASHARMAEHVPVCSLSAVMFNLGYLPGDNHEVTTTASETLAALAVATQLLKSGGVLAVVCYPGHPAGEEEALKVEEYFARLAGHGWQLAKYAMLGTRRPAPFLLLARQGADGAA